MKKLGSEKTERKERFKLKDGDEEKIANIVRKIVKEELDGYQFEVTIPKPKEETEPCPSGGHQLSKTKNHNTAQNSKKNWTGKNRGKQLG